MKKEFVPLTSNPQQLLQTRKTGISSNKNLIKRNLLEKWDTIQQFQPEELNKDKPEITFIEEDGQVRWIHFKCPCGCQAAVKIEAESPNSEHE